MTKKNVAVKTKVTATAVRKVPSQMAVKAARNRTAKRPIFWEGLIQETAAELRTEYQELGENFKDDGFSEIDARKQAFSEIVPKRRKGVDGRNEKRSNSPEDHGNQKKVRGRRLFWY